MDKTNLPHDIEAERAVLSSMLSDIDGLITAKDALDREDFFLDKHKHIFDVFNFLSDKGYPVDYISVVSELNKRGFIELIGGSVYIMDLTDVYSTSANIEHYCKIVKDKAVLRNLIKASNEIINSSVEDSLSTDQIIEIAEKGIFDITQKRTKDGPESIKNILMDTLKDIEEASLNENNLRGITTGFVDLDNKTSGLQKSDLVLVAARPSMGKTAFSVNLALNAANKGNASVAIFSLEMSKNQIAQRMVSSESHIELQKIISGDLSNDPENWIKIMKVLESLSRMNITVDDTPGITLSELRAKCRKIKLESGLDIVLIDYLQLMSGEGRSESRQQEISAISRGLKALAKEMDCTVIALSQLSRAPELRSDHRPILSDLRESGAIEQDADIVMFLYRDDYYNPDSEKKNTTEVIVAKHRNGPTGIVELVFIGEFTKFVNMEKIGNN
ncbi:MAG: replicative DNA helicase [Andreesenia angusta]|nr:replicative DNA helicase [Andreesenia angusta]